MQIRGQQLGSLFDMANKSGALAPVNQFLNDTVDKGLNYLFPQTQMGGGSGQAANPMQLDPMQQQQQTLGLQTPDYTPNDTWSNNSGGQQYWYE